MVYLTFKIRQKYNLQLFFNRKKASFPWVYVLYPYHVSGVKNLQNCENGVQIRATLCFMDARSNDFY